MLSQGASKVNISFVVKDEDLDAAVNNLHRCFFEGSCEFDYFPESEVVVEMDKAETKRVA